MSRLLRKIEKGFWMREDGAPLPADAIRDMSPIGNRLSFYVVADDLSDAADVVAALTLKRGSCNVFDFSTVEYEVLHTLGIDKEDAPGDTKDDIVNRRHIDVVGLTLDKLSALTHALDNPGQRERWQPKKVGEAMAQSIKASRFSRDDLTDSMLSKLQKWDYLDSEPS